MQRRPRPQVIPPEIRRQAINIRPRLPLRRPPFQHRIVDRNALHLRVAFREHSRELRGSPGLRDLLERRHHIRRMFPNRVYQRLRPPKKNPAIPRKVPRHQEPFGRMPVRLLAKTLHPPGGNVSRHTRTLLDVPVAGLHPRRRNPQHHDVFSRRRKLHAGRNHLGKPRSIGHPRGLKETPPSPSRGLRAPAKTPSARMPEPYSAASARSRSAPASTPEAVPRSCPQASRSSPPRRLPDAPPAPNAPASAESSSRRHPAQAPASPAPAGSAARTASHCHLPESPAQTASSHHS